MFPLPTAAFICQDKHAKIPPGLHSQGGFFHVIVLSRQALTQLLAGILDSSLGAGAKITERSGITYTDLYSFLWLRIIVHSSVALATLLFHQDPDTLFSHLYCTDQAYP